MQSRTVDSVILLDFHKFLVNVLYFLNFFVWTIARDIRIFKDFKFLIKMDKINLAEFWNVKNTQVSGQAEYLRDLFIFFVLCSPWWFRLFQRVEPPTHAFVVLECAIASWTKKRFEKFIRKLGLWFLFCWLCALNETLNKRFQFNSINEHVNKIIKYNSVHLSNF
jgi:hypothetical protein